MLGTALINQRMKNSYPPENTKIISKFENRDTHTVICHQPLSVLTIVNNSYHCLSAYSARVG